MAQTRRWTSSSSVARRKESRKRAGNRDRRLPLSLSLQSVFMVDNALGTSVSGPLPEGIEERPRSGKELLPLLPSPCFQSAATLRYYFDGQTILKPGVMGDSAILILRGEAHRVHEIGARVERRARRDDFRQVEALVPEGCAGATAVSAQVESGSLKPGHIRNGFGREATACTAPGSPRAKAG